MPQMGNSSRLNAPNRALPTELTEMHMPTILSF